MQREHLDLYARLFVSRRDDHGIQQPDGRYRRAFAPLDLAAIARHLAGQESLASYVIDEQGRCRYAVFDADDPERGLPQLAELQTTLAREDVITYLEQSRRGGHLWVFLTEAVPASVVRRWLLPYCPASVEFYPKQDESGVGLGSLMRLPLGMHRRSGRRYPFIAHLDDQAQLVPVASTMSDHMTWLASIRRHVLPQEEIAQISARVTRISGAGELVQGTRNTSFATARPLRYASSIKEWNEAQNPFAAIGRYVRLDARGIGRCPFGEHHTDGKDRHPSFHVYLPRSASASCWFCYTWQRGGNVFDFLCLWYGVDAATLWHMLQEHPDLF